MIWIKLFLVMEIGLLPRGDILLYQPAPQVYWFYNIGYTSIEGTVLLWNILYISGGLTTTIENDSIVHYIPLKMNYQIDIGLKYDKIKIGFRHSCIHPVFANLFLDEITMTKEGAFEQIYLQVGGKVDF